jgi:hypothetical protein
MEQRFKVKPNDEHTDGILTIFRDRMEVILRLRWKLRRKIKRPKPLQLSDVVSIPRNQLTGPNEKCFLENARSGFIIAARLYRDGDYRDAYLHHHLAIEHVLKFVLIKSKYAYQARYRDPLPSGHSDSAGKEAHMSHDLMAISNFLVALVPDLKRVTKIQPILRTLATARPTADWATLRYTTNPSDMNTQMEFKVFYLSLRKSALPFIVDLKKQGVFQ